MNDKEGDKETMTCENCIHNGVCYMQDICNDIQAQLDEFGCENFKDKSNIVELPCKFGDIVYIKRDGVEYELHMKSILVNPPEMYIVCHIPDENEEIGKEIHKRTGYGTVLNNLGDDKYSIIFVPCSDIGKSVFMYRNEA